MVDGKCFFIKVQKQNSPFNHIQLNCAIVHKRAVRITLLIMQKNGQESELMEIFTFLIRIKSNKK